MCFFSAPLCFRCAVRGWCTLRSPEQETPRLSSKSFASSSRPRFSHAFIIFEFFFLLIHFFMFSWISFIDPFIYSFTYSFIYSFIPSLIHLSMHLFLSFFLFHVFTPLLFFFSFSSGIFHPFTAVLISLMNQKCINALVNLVTYFNISSCFLFYLISSCQSAIHSSIRLSIHSAIHSPINLLRSIRLFIDKLIF